MQRISVKDRLPGYNDRVLLVTTLGCVIGQRTHTDRQGEHFEYETNTRKFDTAAPIDIEFWYELPE